MSTNNDSEILSALERLGAQFPWETVSVWVERQPAGEVRFTAYIASNYDRATDSAFGHGATLSEACRDLARNAGPRDPEGMRELKIAELKEQIRKLEGVQIGLPPYKPGMLLAPGALQTDIEV